MLASRVRPLMIVHRSIWPRSCATRSSRRRPRRCGASSSAGFTRRLLRLDDDDREIILLRHFEQLSNSEAAQALGLSEAAAGMRHLRACAGSERSWGKPLPCVVEREPVAHDDCPTES